MLPYGLKVVWFAVSLSGLVGSWIVLPLFPRFFIIPSWVPVVYGIANTILQAVFCIGLIWQMDPFRMPRAYCIVQTTLSQVSWSCLCGLCAALSLTSAAAVFDNHSRGVAFQTASSLPIQAALVFLFPTAILGLNLGFSLRLDAIQAADSLNCDASQPIWVRLLGYAGTSLLLAVPSFILSVATAYRLLKVQAPHIEATPPTHAVYTHTALTSIPKRRQLPADSKDRLRPDSAPPFVTNAYPLNIVPSSTSSNTQVPQTLLPDKPGQAHTLPRHSKHDTPSFRHSSIPSSRRQSFQSRATSRTTDSPVQIQDRSRHESYQGPPSPIAFNSPSRNESHAIIVNVTASVQETDTENEKDDRSLHVRPYEIELASECDGVSESLRWAKDSDRGSTVKDVYDYAITEGEEPDSYAFPPYPRIRRSMSGQPPWLDEPTGPDPRLGYIIMFQILCSSTHIIASISTLIDIFSRRSLPTRVGSQHVALLLVSWIPSLMFCLSMCRRFVCGRS